MPPRLPWSELFAAARRRHGVVTTDDAAALGISAETLHSRARREGWERVPLAPGVRLQKTYLAPGATLGDRTRLVAVLAVLGERTAVSHASAAALYGLQRPPRSVHVIVPVDRRPRPRPGLVVTRSRTLGRQHITELDGVRVTTPARTALDLAADRGLVDVLDLLTRMEQQRLATLADLRALAATVRGTSVAGTYVRAVELRGADRTDSALERDTAHLCAQAGFTPYPGPYRVTHPGHRSIHLDVAFPEIGFAIECDGRAYHSDADSFERDRRRWRTARAAGWELTWVTRARLLQDADGIVAEVREAHERAAARLAAGRSARARPSAGPAHGPAD